MKALVCEMCNSSDLIKQDGNFVCQSCGMKYTLEEAKKMMIEGTVKVDNSDFVEKYLQNARRAKQKEDWDETEKYYNMVEQNDPSNIEAIFYSAYGKAKASLSVNEIYKREAIFKALTKSVSILDDNYDPQNSKDMESILEQIVTDVIGLFGSRFVYTETRNGNGQVIGTDSAKTYQLFINVTCEMYNTLEQIYQKVSNSTDKVFIGKLELKIIDYMAKCHLLAYVGRIEWYDRGIFKADVLQKLDRTFTCKNYRAEKAAYEDEVAKNKLKKVIGIIVGVSIGILFIVFCALAALK